MSAWAFLREWGYGHVATGPAIKWDFRLTNRSGEAGRSDGAGGLANFYGNATLQPHYSVECLLLFNAHS